MPLPHHQNPCLAQLPSKVNLDGGWAAVRRKVPRTATLKIELEEVVQVWLAGDWKALALAESKEVIQRR